MGPRSITSGGDQPLHLVCTPIRDALVAYNAELEREGLPTPAMGLGRHRGLGVAGLVGSRDLMQFTVIGRTVNLAARVQTLTRHYDADIVVTDAIREQLDPRFELDPLPPTEVRGVADPVAIFAARDFRAAR